MSSSFGLEAGRVVRPVERAGAVMLGLLKKLLRANVAPDGGAIANEEAGTARCCAEERDTSHAVRVFFLGGPYVVLWRSSSNVGDMIGIAADALRATRYRRGSEIVAVTVDVDPTETIHQLRHLLATPEPKGYALDAAVPEDADHESDVAVAGVALETPATESVVAAVPRRKRGKKAVSEVRLAA